MSVGLPPSRQWSVFPAEARNLTQPSWAKSQVERSVAIGASRSPPLNGSRKNVAGARELAHRRLHHRLLVLAARDVRPRRVVAVLADPRVDQRPVSVHVLDALGELPPRPRRALARRVRAVELVREDLLGHVHVDPADRVDELLEGAEVDDHDVVDREPRERLDRLHGERRAADLHRRVDLLVTVAGDRGPEVAWNRQVHEPVAAGIGTEQHHRVGVLVGAPPRLAVVGVVGAEQQDVRRRGEDEPALWRERRRRARGQPPVRRGDAPAHRHEPCRRPGDEKHDEHEQGERARSVPTAGDAVRA